MYGEGEVHNISEREEFILGNCLNTVKIVLRWILQSYGMRLCLEKYDWDVPTYHHYEIILYNVWAIKKLNHYIYMYWHMVLKIGVFCSLRAVKCLDNSINGYSDNLRNTRLKNHLSWWIDPFSTLKPHQWSFHSKICNHTY